MILVDTSAWIDLDWGTRSATARRLVDLISSGGPQVAVTEPVLMEVLAGARDQAAAAQLRRLLTSFGWIPVDVVADFEAAAKVYGSSRAAVSPPWTARLPHGGDRAADPGIASHR